MADSKNSLITVPGIFFVELDESTETPKVVRFSFQPLASDAGYFGPSADYFVRGSFIHTIEPLDLEDVDGPFWKAVQHALEPFTYVTVADPDEEQDEHVGHRVPIEWTE